MKIKTTEYIPVVFEVDLSKLLKDISSNPKINTTTKLSLQFTALTVCKSGEGRRVIVGPLSLIDYEGVSRVRDFCNHKKASNLLLLPMRNECAEFSDMLGTANISYRTDQSDKHLPIIS